MKKNLFIITLIAAVCTSILIPFNFLNADIESGTSLDISKTASVNSTGNLTWSIDMSVDQDLFYLTTGQTAIAEYTVKATPIFQETGKIVSGNIHIQNIGGEIASINYVQDRVEYKAGEMWYWLMPKYIGGLFTIPIGGFKDIPYSLPFTSIEGATAYRNTALVGLKNSAIPDGGVGFEEFRYTTDFSISDGIVAADAFADVYDSLIGYLGKTWVGDPSTYVYTYSIFIGPYLEPGDYTIDNTATIIGKDSYTAGKDSLTITVHVDAANTGKDTVNIKKDIMIESGIPGKGLENAPGQQKSFNPKSQAAENAGMKK
jgi:hypothetical protein